MLDWLTKRYMMCQEAACYRLGRGLAHFSLMSSYTRFTSPLRRLPDLLVHQQVHALLEGKSPPALRKDQVRELNEYSRRAKRAKRDSNLIHLSLFLLQHQTTLRATALIVSVGSKILELFCSEYALTRKFVIRREVSGAQQVKVIGPSTAVILFKAGGKSFELRAEKYGLVEVELGGSDFPWAIEWTLLVEGQPFKVL